jgi:tRNA/tmRNA/rRNA uracil-C5-methylase (TrmA/RlmC/RlmD family)
MRAGDVVSLSIDKPAAGGRMLARHEGQVVLVANAIPGERVQARVERTGKGVAFAETVDVVEPSPDRRPAVDWKCGGAVLGHIAYDRQRALKAEIIQDAFLRIGRHPLRSAPPVLASPEHGYRMRARLHARDGRLGFYREGTHDLCDAARTGQLAPATVEWLASMQSALTGPMARELAALEIAENVAGDQRACHLELHSGGTPRSFAPLTTGLRGLSAQAADSAHVVVVAGEPAVVDVVRVREEERSADLRLRRDARAFFQGNRYLLEPFVRLVAERVPDGPVIDLYAGVGLFGLALAAGGCEDVTLVEGDPISSADLEANAVPFGDRVRVEHRSVEVFLRGKSALSPATTVVLDPPRTGLSKDALAGLIASRPPRLVYVSCDPATLARDTRGLLDAGYELGDVTGVDLFPNTAHVETVCTFTLS